MKNHLVLASVILAMMTSFLSGQIFYDSSNGDPNPVTQGWDSAEIVAGADGNNDGLIDAGANAGPISVGGESVWQINDQLTSGTENGPVYWTYLADGKNRTSELLEKGWELSFTIRVRQQGASAAFAGFCGWAISRTDAPAEWNIPTGMMARVGFLVGSDVDGSFFVTAQPRLKVTLPDAIPSGFHVIKAVGVAGTQDYEWFVDGVSQGFAKITDHLISSTADTQVNFQAGSNSGVNGATEWKSVSLNERETPTVVINSDTLAITDGGVKSSEVFRGVPFKASFYNGLARFVFAGDLEFTPEDRVVGEGGAAISLTVSGDVTIPEGAVVDVSALANRAGPGGGVAGFSVNGGDAGNGRGGGGAVAGGKKGEGGASIVGVNYPGTWGTRGDYGINGTAGYDGKPGVSGQAGRSGYRSPNLGGIFIPTTTSGDAGAGGSRGARSTGRGSGGAPGAAGGFSSRKPGSPGGNATGNGGKGGDGFPGKPGADGGAGGIVRGFSSLTGGGGGASGQGGGGGGGGGGAGSGASGGGGGGEGAAGVVSGRDGGAGGASGAGGHGGQGGAGGRGGAGGHGGGAIEIIAFGKMKIAGTLMARGTGGQPGDSGAAATNTSRTNGANGKGGANVDGGGDGGDGTKGGNGGYGGAGGNGGRGGGGAGGTIRLMAAAVDTTGMLADVSGGGNGGATGRLLVLSDTGNYTGEILRDGEVALEEYTGQREINTHLSDFDSTPLLPGLVGGSEVAGVLNGLNLGSFPGVLSGAPSDAYAAVLRLDVGPEGYSEDYEGFDFLIYFNLTAAPLRQPVLGAGAAGYVGRMIDGGLASNSAFGGTGPDIKEQLEAYGAYATLIPDDSENVTFGFSPEGTLIRKSISLPALGETSYLSYSAPRPNGEIPAPTVHPEPSLTLPEVGPVVSFALNGSVQVNITPVGAVTAGSGWFLKGSTPVYPGGTIAGDLPAGEHLLSFTRIPGWLPPRDQIITVQPDGTTVVNATFIEAPTTTIENIAPQRVRYGDVLGFYLPAGTTVNVASGSTNGTVLIGPDGWFSYEPASNDRAPFDLLFSNGGVSKTVTVTPVQDLPAEQAIIALEPVADPPVRSGRDYTFIHSKEAAEGVNYRTAANSREVTVSGVTLILSDTGDTQLFDLVHNKKNTSKLNLYADKVIVRSTILLQGTDVTIYARQLIFEDESGTAALDTTAVAQSAAGDGEPQQGGDITLHVQEILGDPTASARLVLGGADSTVPNQDAADSGLLSSPFDLNEFADISGGVGVEGGDPGSALAAVIHPQGVVPAGLAWVHPLAVRSVILYAKDIYYLGFMDAAGELLREYEGFLGALNEIENLPDLPNADLAGLQLSEQFSDISGLVDRISDRLDFYGNSAGWVPLLSFEANFNLTENTIGRAMRAFYLAHWLSAAENNIEDRQAAMGAARDALGEETDALKAEFPNVQDEVRLLGEKSQEIDDMTIAVEKELKEIERRLEQKAEEIVEERNNVPFWKTALRTAGTIMKAVPFYQPALGAAGGALEIGSRIDEQDPLDTVLQVADLALEYKAADYDQKAQEINDEINPPEPKSDKEMERDELLGKAQNMRSTASGVAQAGSALKDFLASREVPAGEIAAELEKIRASDPQFNGVVGRLQELMDEKERFARRIAALEDRLREIPGIILKNRIAMITLGDSIDAGNTVLDPQALSVVKEMEARNKDRLRRYFYLLAKSFEYRLLEPYRLEGEEVYDPVAVLDKIKEILIASQEGGSSDTQGSQHHVLSPAGFETLRSALEEDLILLTERIINTYGDGEEEQTSAYRTFLREEELECINKPNTPAVLNLHKRGVYSAGEESHRIESFKVTDVDFALTIGGERVELNDDRLQNLSSATIDLIFVHSGLTKLSRKGQTYAFNHFRNGDPTKNPIRWTGKVNLLTKEVTMVTPSEASDSLLRTLLGTGNELNILNFSRPGANADIFVTAENLNPNFSGGLPPAGLGVEFTRIGVEAQLDYFTSTAERLVDVRIIDPTGVPLSILPLIRFDNPQGSEFTDFYGRRDSWGAISRSFLGVDQLVITADDFYGSELAAASAHPSGYQFSRWLDQSFNEISNTNQVQIANIGRKRIYAIYEKIGDLEAPEVEDFRIVGTEGNIVTYEVVFSEDVIGVDITDFAVEGEAPGGAAVRSVSGTGRTRLVKVDLSAVPTTSMTLSLLDDDSILDITGNSLSGDGKGNGNQAAAISGTGGNTLTLSDFGVVEGLIQFTLRGKAGTDYRIESSTTLEGGWAFEETITTNGVGSATVVDDTPPSGKKFYRAVEQP